MPYDSNSYKKLRNVSRLYPNFFSTDNVVITQILCRYLSSKDAALRTDNVVITQTFLENLRNF